MGGLGTWNSVDNRACAFLLACVADVYSLWNCGSLILLRADCKDNKKNHTSHGIQTRLLLLSSSTRTNVSEQIPKRKQNTYVEPMGVILVL